MEAKRTPLTTAAAEQAIAQAYSDLTGNVLNDSARSILTAQWAHETAHGASMFNFNFGGIKGVGPSGMTVAQRTREGFGTSERRIVDSFRAYASAEEGAKDYVRLLLARYGSAVSAAEQGDATGFVRGLKEKGYFTGDPAAYERSIASIADQILGSSGAIGSVSTSRDALVAQAIPPDSNPVSAPNGPSQRGLGSRLPEWQRTLTPSALFEVAGASSQSRSLTDDITGLTAISALQMSDEVTRAALRIALTDDEESRSGQAATSARR